MKGHGGGSSGNVDRAGEGKGKWRARGRQGGVEFKGWEGEGTWEGTEAAQ